MCCPFDTAAMDKQTCFVLLSCIFVTVYLQETDTSTVMNYIRNKLKNGDGLSVSGFMVFESFTVMSQTNYLALVRATNNRNEAFICTVIVKTEFQTNSIAMAGTHCSEEHWIPKHWARYINTDTFQKIINKAVDRINEEGFRYKRVATSLKEVKLTAFGLPITFTYTFEIVVAKTSCSKESDNRDCPILTDNQEPNSKYFVVGQIDPQTSVPWIVTLEHTGYAMPTN